MWTRRPAPGGVLSSGSVVRRGEGNGVVMLTGAKTYFGRTTELVQQAQPKLHIEAVVAKVVRWLFVIVGALLGVVAILSLVRGAPLLEMVPLLLVLLMSAVPVALSRATGTTNCHAMVSKGAIFTIRTFSRVSTGGSVRFWPGVNQGGAHPAPTSRPTPFGFAPVAATGSAESKRASAAYWKRRYIQLGEVAVSDRDTLEGLTQFTRRSVGGSS